MDLDDLYQQLILDHSKNPRNRREMTDASQRSEGHNPLCGDRVTVFLKLSGDRIEDVSFVGSGCAISTASVSLLTEMLKGKSVDEAHAIFNNFHHLLTDSGTVDEDLLEKLTVFSGVKEYPMRVKCATLAWHTLEAALKQSFEVVKTE